MRSGADYERNYIYNIIIYRYLQLKTFGSPVEGWEYGTGFAVGLVRRAAGKVYV